MCSNIMQAIVDPVYFKRTQVISPGVVGSVGDTLGTVRLKQSTPDMAMRYEKAFYGKNEERLGSNVQDGNSVSYTTGGGPSRTLELSWDNRTRRNHGFAYQDLRQVDKRMEPIVGSTGRYTWNNKIANVIQEKLTGDLFYPLPGLFAPTSMTRGNQYPQVTDIIGPEKNYSDLGIQPDLKKKLLDNADKAIQSVVDKNNGVMCTRAGAVSQEELERRKEAVKNPPAPSLSPNTTPTTTNPWASTPWGSSGGGWFT